MLDRCPARALGGDRAPIPWFVSVGGGGGDESVATATNADVTLRMAPLYTVPLSMVIDAAEGGEGGVGTWLRARDDAYFEWALPYSSPMRVRVLATSTTNDGAGDSASPVARVSAAHSALCPSASHATYREASAEDAARAHDAAERTQSTLFELHLGAGDADVPWMLHIESARAAAVVGDRYFVRVVVDQLEPQCPAQCVPGHGQCGVDGLCHCSLLYSGADCSQPRCMPPCGEHGACAAPNQCNCEPRWEGAFCIDFVHDDRIDGASTGDSSLPVWAIVLITIAGLIVGVVLGALALHYWRRYQAYRRKYEVVLPGAREDAQNDDDDDDDDSLDIFDSSSDDSEF
jgi:hypothetical protein